jgi:5'(3')-deoxyribonucleotidase
MIIGIDVDETVLALIPSWLKKYNFDFGDDLRPNEITDWDLSQFVTKECGQSIFDYIKTPDVFKKAKPIYGAIHAISYLKSLEHRIIFITVNNPDNVKNWWLKNYGFMENDNDLVISLDKSLIKCDFLVDDHIDNLLNIDGIGILFTQPHNKNIDWYPRANSWEEVISIIEGWSDKE